jgi:hypothetical protein
MFHHHAVLLVGVSSAVAVDQVRQSDVCAEVHLLEERDLGIDLVRSLVDIAHRSPAIGYDRQYIIVGFDTATVEAQNAFLKLLEEPPQTTQFVLCVPTQRILLPTVVSRLLIIESVPQSTATQLPTVLSLPLKDALALIERQHKLKDKIWFVTEHQAFVAWAYGLEMQTLPAVLREAIILVLTRLNTRGASNRWLLEHVVLSYAQYSRSE